MSDAFQPKFKAGDKVVYRSPHEAPKHLGLGAHRVLAVKFLPDFDGRLIERIRLESRAGWYSASHFRLLELSADTKEVDQSAKKERRAELAEKILLSCLPIVGNTGTFASHEDMAEFAVTLADVFLARLEAPSSSPEEERTDVP